MYLSDVNFLQHSVQSLNLCALDIKSLTVVRVKNTRSDKKDFHTNTYEVFFDRFTVFMT